MHDLLFANMNTLEIEDFLRHSQSLKLNTSEFQQCLEKGKYEPEIRKDMAEGQRSGVKGTPTFLVGVMEQDPSKIRALKRIRGAQPFPVFKETLDNLLAPQK